jgi:peptidoglycan/xylan/chitin deacetylase (PgdA/CDA1 family)
VPTPFVSRRRELDRAQPARFRARRALRRAVLAALARRPRQPRPGVRIVHYHYVFDDERDAFLRQLEFLAATYRPVSLSEAANRLRDGRIEGREVVVTFDDGFRNQVVNAAPLLAERGFSACFFLLSGFVSAEPPEAERVCRGRLHLPRPVEPMSWEDVARLGALGHEVGSHTRSHPDLTALSAAELDEELRVSRGELERRLGSPPAHFSAPYGDRERFSTAVSDAARRVGYASCATAQRGLNTGPGDLYALRRDHLEAGWPVADVRYFLGRA